MKMDEFIKAILGLLSITAIICFLIGVAINDMQSAVGGFAGISVGLLLIFAFPLKQIVFR
jgi:hypothetical protein